MSLGVGRRRSQPCGLTERKWERLGCLLWGRAVIREVIRGPPPFPPLCPSLKFLISFLPGEGFAILGTAKGVTPAMVRGPSSWLNQAVLDPAHAHTNVTKNRTLRTRDVAPASGEAQLFGSGGAAQMDRRDVGAGASL